MADALADAGVDVAAWVPESRLDAIVTRLAARGVAVRTLTREEECVAYAAGRRLGGGHPVVMMQSSGLGNALNALGSLVVPYGLGIPMVISMRGTLGEGNPAQVPMGRAVRPLLDALGLQAFTVRCPTRSWPRCAASSTWPRARGQALRWSSSPSSGAAGECDRSRRGGPRRGSGGTLPGLARHSHSGPSPGLW